MKVFNRNNLEHKLSHDLCYSVRRYYVDKFFFEAISLIAEQSSVLDMGGKKNNKRGVFDISKYNLNVKYANIDKKTEPDFLCDISSIPVQDNSFDAVILSEVLEHISAPSLILKEAYRILKPGGKLLMVTPFMFHVHADPYDYARYTDYWYSENLANEGYKNIKIEKQGLFFSVFVAQLKIYVYELRKLGKPENRVKRLALNYFVNWFVKHATKWDSSDLIGQSSVFRNTTTGYGVICEK